VLEPRQGSAGGWGGGLVSGGFRAGGFAQRPSPSDREGDRSISFPMIVSRSHSPVGTRTGTGTGTTGGTAGTAGPLATRRGSGARAFLRTPKGLGLEPFHPAPINVGRWESGGHPASSARNHFFSAHRCGRPPPEDSSSRAPPGIPGMGTAPTAALPLPAQWPSL